VAFILDALSVKIAATLLTPISLITVSNYCAIKVPVCCFSLVSIAFQNIGLGVVTIKLIIDSHHEFV